MSTERNHTAPENGGGNNIPPLPEDAHPIKLSSKTLVHISSGLYRSTANALKELVSNSFDADAKVIRINTNYPEFDVLTCSDNGNGMTKKEFEWLMDGGIGNSPKRVDETGEDIKPKHTKMGRPVIGRLGIGMLAIAQVCYEFKIVSHHRESKKAFQAVLNLSPYRAIEVSAEEVSAEDEDKKEYEIGYYKCEEIDYDPKQDGVLISTNDLLSTYIERYREDVRRENFRRIPKKFEDFVKEVTKKKHRTITSLGDYWRLFWELSVSCPIPYMDEGPFRQELLESAVSKDSREEAKDVIQVIKGLKEELESYNFKVILDGVSLRKPLLIPNNEKDEIEARLTPISYDKDIIGLPLKFRGYIYTQSSEAIYPRELRGILIRVRNVAIGSYDYSCLNYETVQGFRFDWLSGEVYVEEGMEDALNIDRHSFNEVHPHYRTLQKHVHHLLKAGKVFTEARRAAEARNKLKTQKRQEELDRKYLAAVQKVLNARYKIQYTDEAVKDGMPVEVDSRKKIVHINSSHSLWPKRKSERLIVEKVLVAFKLAQAHSSSPNRIDEKALAILKEVF
jgi:hypothetical protein